MVSFSQCHGAFYLSFHLVLSKEKINLSAWILPFIFIFYNASFKWKYKNIILYAELPNLQNSNSVPYIFMYILFLPE